MYDLELSEKVYTALRKSLFSRIKDIEKEITKSRHGERLFEFIQVDNVKALIVYIDKTIDPTNLISTFLTEQPSGMLIRPDGKAQYVRGTNESIELETDLLASFLRRTLGSYCEQEDCSPSFMSKMNITCAMLHTKLEPSTSHMLLRSNMVINLKPVNDIVVSYDKYCSKAVEHFLDLHVDVDQISFVFYLSSDQPLFDKDIVLSSETLARFGRYCTVCTCSPKRHSVTAVLLHLKKL